MKFFFKQWGGVRKHQTGRMLDGRTYDDMPRRATREVPERSARLKMIEDVEDRDGRTHECLVPLRVMNKKTA